MAYYITSINIERAYHDIAGGDYVPFEGICLTDTFQMGEKNDLVDALLVDNSKRRKRQMALDIRVILGNPPYSVGQRSENDNNENVAYPHLDNPRYPLELFLRVITVSLETMKIVGALPELDIRTDG